VSNDETVDLLNERFSEFPLGQFPHDYGPWGEYHYMPPAGYRGVWYEPTCLYSWSTGRWQVVEEDDRRWLEQCASFERGIAMLVAGDPVWDDYTVSVDLQPLSTRQAIGLMGRYRDSRNHYLFRLAVGERAELLSCSHEGERLLAQVPFAYDVDTTYSLSLCFSGSQIAAMIDGRQIFDVQDATLTCGRIGLWAITPGRFGDVCVTCEPERRAAIAGVLRRQGDDLQKLRECTPQPELWRVLDTVGFGCGRTLRVGDLDGDGRLEFLLVQHVRRHTGDSHAMISCLTALDLDGDILWQRGRPSSAWEHAYDTCDLACQVYDLDGDGCAEVIFCQDFWLNVVDGRTGELKARRRMPVATPGEEDEFDRTSGDAIYICNLSGRPRPTDILVKNRYHQVWAYDRHLEPLWTHRGNTGHFYNAYDIDGDGCDELMVGYTLLDSDGSIMWQHDMGDHVDEIAIGHFDPAREEPQIAVVAGEAGFIIFDHQGRVLVQDRIGHAQRLSVAKYRPDLDGLQYYVVTFWGNPGIILLYNCAGQRLHSFEPTSTGHVLNPVNWTGDGQELALLNASSVDGGLIDGLGRRVVVLPKDGHPVVCCETLDLTGDPRDELMVWDHRRIFIYTQDRPFEGSQIYHPVRRPHWNASNYRAEVSLPHWQPVT
jgi:hypothetical protein